MWKGARRRPARLLRDGVVMLTLISHLFVTFGLPLPLRCRKPGEADYPCHHRPCGCLTSEQCWKGDCCCFTLEEKLAWAEANGVEPPKHVRSLVKARSCRPVSPEKQSCCQESEPSATCAECAAVASAPCSDGSCCQSVGTAKCSHCPAQSEPKHPDANSFTKQPGVRWVVGLFAQKCRGEGPAGLLQLDFSIVSELIPVLLVQPDCSDFIRPSSDRATPRSIRPPTPPPRSC